MLKCVHTLVHDCCFEESSITPLPGGSVIYPVEGEVKYSFGGWQGSKCRVAICPRLRPDILFFSAAWPIFWMLSFSFSLLFARKCIFQVFYLAFLIFYFLNSFTVGLFVILCRTCRKLPPGVICAVPVESVCFEGQSFSLRYFVTLFSLLFLYAFLKDRNKLRYFLVTYIVNFFG